MSAGTERARCRALLWLLARCASATASAAASAAVNGRWFILALLMELSPLPLLLERPRGERSRLPLMAQASGARSSATTLKPERPLETLGWNLLGKLLLPTVPQTQPNTLQPNKPPCANKTLFRSSCTKQAVKLWLQSCAAGTGLHFLFLSCHLSHTGRQRLQVSSCSNTHFSGTSRLLRNFQNKQF